MGRYFFEGCEIDTGARSLRRQGRLVDLQPLVFDLLCHFVTHPRTTVRHEELLQAVWRSPVVSDSVVARAIMKLRRAIGDDARAPRMLRTVPKIGYRLDVEVTHDDRAGGAAPAGPALPPVAYELAVLPFHMPEDWPHDQPGGPGLSLLAHHLGGDALDWVLVPMRDVALVQAGPAEAGDGLARACRLFGAREALQCRLVRDGPVLRLHALKGVSLAQAHESIYSGGDAVRLTRRMMASLCGGAEPDAADRLGHDGHELLAGALGAEAAGDAARALRSLAACQAQLPAAPRLHYARARMLLGAGRPEQALAALDDALAVPGQPPRPVARVVVHAVRARTLLGLGRFDDARAEAERGLAAAEGQVLARTLVPELLAIQSSAALEHDEREAAIRLAERGLARATLLGSELIEARARHQLGRTLVLYEVPQQADEVAQQAMKHARRLRLASLEALALDLELVRQVVARRYGEALAVARQLLPLARAAGAAELFDRAEHAELMLLIFMDRAEEALACRYACAPLDELPPDRRARLVLHRAVLAWKLGRQHGAVARLRTLAEWPDEGVHISQRLIDDLLIEMLPSLGRLDEAHEVAQRIAQGGDAARSARAWAEVHLAGGARERAREALLSWWHSEPGVRRHDIDTRVCLAWLLLEDEAPGAPDERLDALAGALIDLPSQRLSRRLFQAAYLLRRSSSAPARAHWDALVADAPPLRRHAPWLAEPAYGDALAHGDALRPLRGLLTSVCL